MKTKMISATVEVSAINIIKEQAKLEDRSFSQMVNILLCASAMKIELQNKGLNQEDKKKAK